MARGMVETGPLAWPMFQANERPYLKQKVEGSQGSTSAVILWTLLSVVHARHSHEETQRWKGKESSAAKLQKVPDASALPSPAFSTFSFQISSIQTLLWKQLHDIFLRNCEKPSYPISYFPNISASFSIVSSETHESWVTSPGSSRLLGWFFCTPLGGSFNFSML